MNVIADITRAYTGTAAQVLDRVLRAGPGISITVLMHDDQLAELRLNGVDVEALAVKSISRMTSVPEVALQMALEAAGSAAMTVVFSFRPPVLALASQLDITARTKVVFAPWSMASNYLRGVSTERALQQLPAGVYGAHVPDSEVFPLLKLVLQKRGATSKEKAVQKTSIRPLLAERDARFSKLNPATSSPNFVTKLLDRAKHAGWLAAEDTQGNNANVWLVQESASAAKLTLVESVAAAPPLASPIAPARTPVAAKDLYPAILKSNNMGPFQNLRDDLYTALESTASQRLPLEQVITACTDATRAKHSTAKESEIPWTTVRNFFIGLLSRQPVLLTDTGETVVPSFQTRRTVISRLDPQFRERLDGELVLFLLRQGAEILYMDAPALVGTLYPTREGKWEDRLNKVIGYLTDSGQIEFEGPRMVLAKSEPATVVAIRPILATPPSA